MPGGGAETPAGGFVYLNPNPSAIALVLTAKFRFCPLLATSVAIPTTGKRLTNNTL